MSRIGKSLALALSLLLSACAASVQDVEDYSGTLAPGDGVLVVAVDTMVPFSHLRLVRPNDTFSTIAAHNLPTGRSVRFIEVPAGEYQWAAIDLDGRYFVPLDRNKKQSYSFTVRPGVINYPGDLLVTVDDSQTVWRGQYLYSAIRRYSIQLVDRNAMLLDDLTPDQALMVGRLGLVYTGPGDDEFEAYYKGLTASKKGAAQ